MNNKNLISVLFWISSLIANCSLFEPRINTVPDIYIVDQLLNDSEKDGIDKLNQQVIDIKNEVLIQKKANEITEQSIHISQTKLQKQKYNTALLQEKEKLAAIKDDKLEIISFRNAITNSESDRIEESTRLKSWKQKEKEDKAYYQYLEAKLSESIVELELLRSEVAVKKQRTDGITTEDKEFIVREKFNKQYLKAKADTEKKRNRWNKIKSDGASIAKVSLDETYTERKY